MKLRVVSVVFCLLAIAAGCTSAPSVRDRFENLDYDSKSAFITYYPELTPEQREEFLNRPTDHPHQLLSSWGIAARPQARKITDLQIEIGTPQVPLSEPITQGTRVPLHAFAVYSRGSSRVEVTADADWRVGSSVARVDRDGSQEQLKFGCVDSDLTVYANFLGERDASRTLQIRKPLEFLEMKVSEAYVGVDSGYNFKLVLLAHCQDGTTSDVSCQATWRSGSDAGHIEGCGNFIVSSKEKLAREEALLVTASYGNLSLRKTLHPPVR